MSTLYLIRHGQAPLGAGLDDALTERGEVQSQRLGAYWAASMPALDAVFTGPALRHRDTAHHALAAARTAGARVPEPSPIEELDEYPGMELLRRSLPKIAETTPELADRTVADAVADPRALGRAIERLTEMWVRGELDTGGLERFEDFDARVCRGLDHVMEACGRGARAAVFTSGGPIGVAARAALDLDPEKAVAVSRVIFNTSITELRFRSRELGLVSLNATPHLSPEDVTPR